MFLRNRNKMILGYVLTLLIFIPLTLAIITQNWSFFLGIALVYLLYLMVILNHLLFKIGDRSAGIALIFCGIIIIILVMDVMFDLSKEYNQSLEELLILFFMIVGFFICGSSFILFWYRKHHQKDNEGIGYIK